MIGKISGRLEYRSTDHILIDVRGVGYIVYVSNRVLAGLPGNGEAVALYTDLLVREDNLQLSGFTTLVEKEWHRLLMSVQGIGAKASMAILGTLGDDGVSRAIALGDWNALAKAKGVGPKTARRIVKPNQVFSRIHVDDIAQVLAASIARPNPGAVYNVCDDDPAPPEDVIALAAELLDLPVPPAEDFATADMTPMARSFYAESKRVRNDRIKTELGVTLKHPDYREGLAALLNDA